MIDIASGGRIMENVENEPGFKALKAVLGNTALVAMA